MHCTADCDKDVTTWAMPIYDLMRKDAENPQVSKDRRNKDEGGWRSETIHGCSRKRHWRRDTRITGNALGTSRVQVRTTPSTPGFIMSDDGKPDFDRLTPRQRECLRLVYERLVSKQIAIRLGIRSSTVDTYLTEAIGTLGAKNRRHAAELLHAYEYDETTPRKFELESSRVAEPFVFRAQDGAGSQILKSLDLLPLRNKGTNGNDLTAHNRIFWSAQLGVGLAIGFGMLVVGLEVISRLLSQQ